MDKFEKVLESLKGLNEEGLAKFMFDNKGLCACPTCTTYATRARKGKEVLYCLSGKSPGCTPILKKCACVRCPVHFKLNFVKGSFCIKGSEEEQRKKR